MTAEESYEKFLAYYHSNDFVNALSQIDQTIRIAAGNTFYLGAKGSLLMDMEKIEEAFQIFEIN